MVSGSSGCVGASLKGLLGWEIKLSKIEPSLVLRLSLRFGLVEEYFEYAKMKKTMKRMKENRR